MIIEHSAHSTPLPFGIRTWLWRYTCLLLLFSMLWHRQAIFELKGDKLSSSVECRIWTQMVSRNRISSRLNVRWQTDWAIEDQAKIIPFTTTISKCQYCCYSIHAGHTSKILTYIIRQSFPILRVSMYVSRIISIECGWLSQRVVSVICIYIYIYIYIERERERESCNHIWLQKFGWNLFLQSFNIVWTQIFDIRSIFLAKFYDAGFGSLVYFFFSRILKFIIELSLGTMYAYQITAL